MAELRIIHGKKSIKYNHFADYEFRSCKAVASRLMGVTALMIKWCGKSNSRAALYQIIHLDYSEYGIDEYREFECIPGESDMSEKKHEMKDLWDHFISVMGSEVTDVSAAVMMKLIEEALPLAKDDRDREFDTEENREFRRYASLRMGYMMDALSAAGISASDCSEDSAIRAVVPASLSAYETINYFVMRLVDRDFNAAGVLTNMQDDRLRDSALVLPGVQTLMRCNIDKGKKKDYPPSDGSSFPFCCRATTLSSDGYHYFTFVIWLSGNAQSRNPLVTDIRIGSSLKLSEYEAAIQIATPEFITVFRLPASVASSIDIYSVSPFNRATEQIVPNGMRFVVYKPDNSHVGRSEYRLEGDVMGYALLSLGGELVLMSHELRNISIIEDAIAYSQYAPFIDLVGRFRVDSTVFQTLCMSPSAVLADLVEQDTDQ